ncbi:sugar transferase [Nodularia sphaerocarpa]|uniref:sugar transferase n=1 Tax=Nodularia sphaerocarpa TaxID=137816 RepID=UPI001EFBE5C9|nr:sugar transferase [Nodularia sphaerocarpa]MDB9374348.1 sugar transferase [Nodularia sphaerocarpa CS-585]MDB9379247.1 sugar transferase [Nodularia sphaerocarpa CS-585A2]ULP70394.1 Undecaprenyl phosphate N,N'-diacetylbacillosamine 1-phosphate transferase [Nodularia sphaerocarpa UHCC 0038]
MIVENFQGAIFTKNYNKFIKSVLDKLVAVILLFFCLPVMLIVAIAIYIQMGKPIVFSQQRPGKKGRIFNCYKFRTMTNKRNRDGQLLSDSERITNLGKFLRQTSLDELPQLWSVLKGDMSFVGPRPLLVQYLPYYSEKESQRHLVLPGITGLAQVKGRNKLSWKEILALDIQYVEQQSLALDLYILFMTVWKVIARSDIDVVNQLEDFDQYRKKQLEIFDKNSQMM